MVNNLHRNYLLRLILGLICIVVSIIFSINYFTLNGTAKDVQDLWDKFYPNIRLDWAVLTESKLKNYMSCGKMNPWYSMVIRTAFDRWRLRLIAPEVFDNIMDDYERGLWISPKREIWTKLFNDFDQQWLRARRESVQKLQDLKMNDSLVVLKRQRDKIKIEFSGLPMTTQLGTYIRLVADTETKYLPKSAPRILWATEKVPVFAAHRRRLGLWLPIDGAPEGLQRFKINVDMSWEPDWMAPGTKAHSLCFISEGVEHWKNVNVEFEDSPFLKPFETDIKLSLNVF